MTPPNWEDTFQDGQTFEPKVIDRLKQLGSSGVQSVSAADSSITIGGTASDPTIAVAGGGGSSVVLTQTFSMTAQQIKDSQLTPHTIIAAQGADTFTVPTMYVLRLTANTTPFNDSNLDLVYGNLDLNVLTTVLNAGVDTVIWTSGAISSGFSEGGVTADHLNQPVKFAANLRGSIAAAAPLQNGTGYAVGDTGTVDDGGTLATYRVDTLGAGNSVNSLTITAGGDNYSLAAARAQTEWTTTPAGAQPGAGSGLTIAVTAVDAAASVGDGTLAGIIYYVVANLT